MQPTLFINHGGGPCFFLDAGPFRDAWRELESYLTTLIGTLNRMPTAIVVVSGHWETPMPTVNAGASPSLLFDYSGFPQHTYELEWPAPGDPALAARIRALLTNAGIASSGELARGWDHGVFVPLKVMLPRADIPVVQLSLQQGLDPAAHLAIGRALKPLRAEGVLIVGSGQSYHNLGGFRAGAVGEDEAAAAFDAWLRTTIADSATRDQALVGWERAPGARHAQPVEDHLLPLMVAAGAATGEPGHIDFRSRVFGKPISGFRFG